MALRTCPIRAAAGAPLPMTSPTLKKTVSSLELEDVVPVAAGVGARPPRPGTRRRAGGPPPRATSRGARRAAAPRRRRAPAGTVWRSTGRHRPGSPPRWPARRRPPRTAGPGPSTKVMTPMTSPLAVSGTASAVVTPCGSARPRRPRAGPAACGPCGRRRRPARRSRRGGRRRRAARRRRGLGRRRPGLAHVEPDEPALAGHLDRARVGQPALDQAHGPPDHGGGLEARAEQPGHLREEGQALAPGLGVAERLPLVLEHLGPLERLRRQPGQRGEEAEIGLARLGVGHEGEREDSERADAADERLAHDGHRLGQLVQRPAARSRSDRSRHRARPGRRCVGDDGAPAREARRPRGSPPAGTMARESRAGWPLLARQVRPRSPAAGTRTTADCAPRARRPPAMAAWATSPGVVAAARAELSWCRCWLRSRLTNSVRVSRARSTAWAAAPVMVKRKVRSGSEISRSSFQCTTTAPMVWSDTTRGTMASARNRLESTAERMSGRWRWRSSTVSAKRATFLPRTGPSVLQRGQHAVDRIVGVVAEAAQRPEDAHVVEEGEGRGVDAQLVAQRGEDGVGHLGRVGGGREGPCHGLHALRRLGGDAPAPLVPGLGSGRPELHVALAAQVRDPHRHRGGGQHGSPRAACGSARRSCAAAC